MMSNMRRILSLCVVGFFVISSIANAGNFKLVIKDDEKFRLVPENTLNSIVKDLKSIDGLRLRLDSLTSINETNDGITLRQKRIISDLELKNEIWSKEIKIREGYTNQLELLYDFEIKENERLRLSKPNIIIWTIGGFTIGISLVYLASMVLKNSR